MYAIMRYILLAVLLVCLRASAAPAFSNFDDGQFRASAPLGQIAVEPAVTNAAGANVTFDLAFDAANIFQTTNTANQTITIANMPTLTGRSKTWLIRVVGDNSHTLTFAGTTPTLRFGTFVSPPPTGINEYYLENIDGTLYYDVLRPQIVTQIGFTAFNSGGLATGKVYGFVTMPYNATITGWNITADAGTCTVKTWKIASGTAKPTVANLISTAGVQLSANTHVRSSDVSDFTTTTVTAGDILAWDLSAVATATEITFGLEITR